MLSHQMARLSVHSQLIKQAGVVTFTPTDKTYSGDVVAVKVQAKDANGTPAETTYTPKITPVVPTAEDVTSKDKQGQTQTGKPKFTEGIQTFQWMMIRQLHSKMAQHRRQFQAKEPTQ